MARRLETRYTFTPGAAGVGTVVIGALYKLNEVLMITNVTNKAVIYSFADATRGATISQVLSTTEPTTTLTLVFDTTAMSSADVLQIYVEQDAVTFQPIPNLIDPVGKFRVSQPNTLIDTDFEYGLQATKWETLELVNNIPGFFSKSGDTPLAISGITALNNSTTLTVTAAGHGLIPGTPIDVRGLKQATLEGSYLVGTVSDADTFTFTARTTSNLTGTVSGPYTTIVPGKFYAGSDIDYNTVETNGATPSNISVNTSYIPGFSANTEIYLINTLGTSELAFDATTAINFLNFDTIASTFNPNGVGSLFTTASRVVDPWDFTSPLATRFFYAGAGGNVNTRTITITAHGFTGNNIPVALIPGPNSTIPTGLPFANAGYIVKTVDANTITLASNVGGVDHGIIAGTGSGIIGLFRGFQVTATNVNDQLTLAGVQTTFNAASAIINTNTPMLWFTSNATIGMGTAAPIYPKSVPGYLYDGTAAQVFYWRGAAYNTISVTAGGGGANVDITGTVVSNNTILVPVTVNSTGNSFYIPNHGFLNNEPYFYYNGGGTTIGGLTTNTTYYIDFISTTQFGLKPTAVGTRINLTNYAATGTTHLLTYNRPRANADSISITTHGFIDGTAVTYSASGGTQVGGLTDLTTYYVKNSTTNSFQLSTSQGGDTVDLTSAGTGTQKFSTGTTGAFDGTYLIANVNTPTEFTLTSSFTVPLVVKSFASTSVFTGNSIIGISSHRLVTGSNVQYSQGSGSPITGLTNTGYYYVIRVNKDRIQLADTLANALVGTGLTLSSAGTGADQSLTTRNLAGETTGSGTIAINTADPKTVTGTGTTFVRSFKVGDTIVVDTGLVAVERVVSFVASDTILTVTEDFTSTLSGLTYLVKTAVYIKSGAYSLHRPFDGGVEINAGYRADTQIVRQTRRYFRYQSGKGMQASFAINFNPPIDIQGLTAVDTIATVVTRKIHGLRPGQNFTIRDASVQSGTNYYNGNFSVASVPNETTFTYELVGAPSATTAEGFPQLVVTEWGGSKMRAGMFDFQNGMFFEYDGTTLFCVRRNSTQQLAGTATVVNRSNTIQGTNTLFANQLAVGDFIVIRGQSYRVTDIASNSTLTIQPAYRGSNSNDVIMSVTQELRIPQSAWNVDKADGHGVSRYILDTTRIQMVYMDYAWYGAGKVRFGFKGVDGEVIYVHEFKHNNRETEAYLRSGNLPARYEVLNQGAPLYAPSLAHWGTSVIMDGGFEDDSAYLFTAPSKFLTYSGSSATVTGDTGNYYYVNTDGSTGNVISTSSNLSLTIGTTVTVNTANETLTFTAADHGLSQGQVVRWQTTGGTLPGNINNATYYYVIRATNRVIRLATTPAAAASNVAVNISSAGNGAHVIVNNFRFVPTKTSIPGYGERIIHRFTTNASGFAAIGNVPFGTPITATAIAAVGIGYVYRVQPATSPAGGAIVDFFFADAVVDPATTSTNGPLGTINYINTPVSAAVTHTLGSAGSIPSLIPLISIRLAPSVDSGLTGALGVRDVINRMQVSLKSVGASTTHDVELRLILNGQLSSNEWVSQGIPSLSQILVHNDADTVSNGVNIFNFRASGNAPSSSGLRTANTFAADISSILALGNAILGGNGVYPDGPDILTLAAVLLSSSGITVNSPFSVAGRITWSESQA